MKKLLALWILLVIELFFLFKLDINDYESFFMFFVIVGLLFLVSNIFGSVSMIDGPLASTSSKDSIHYNTQAGMAANAEFNTKEGKKRLGGLLDQTNWSYLLFFLLNLIAYFFVYFIEL